MQRQRSGGRSRRLTAYLAGLVLLLAACSPGTTAVPSVATTAPVVSSGSSAPASTGPTAAPTPSQATLKVGWSSEPDTLNPLTTYSTEAEEVLQLIYDKLRISCSELFSSHS